MFHINNIHQVLEYCKRNFHIQYLRLRVIYAHTTFERKLWEKIKIRITFVLPAFERKFGQKNQEKYIKNITCNFQMKHLCDNLK